MSEYLSYRYLLYLMDVLLFQSKGFAFICYEDQRSTILSVDNFNGMKLLGRLVRVDHVHTYKLPKDLEKMDADRRYNIAKVGWDIEGLSTKSYSKDNEVNFFILK